MAREAGDVRSIAIYTINLGLTAASDRRVRAGGDARAARLRKCIWELGDGLGSLLLISSSGSWRSPGTISTGPRSSAWRPYEILQERAEIPGIDFALDVLAGVAASRGEIGKAARLWGAAAGSREATDLPWIPDERAMIEPHIDAARARLDEADLDKRRGKMGDP